MTTGSFVATLSYCCVSFFLTFLQEICVSNHTQKQQKRQTINKDSTSHQVLQVDVFLIMMWLFTSKLQSVTPLL